VVVEDVSGAAERIAREGHAVATCGDRIGYFEEDAGSPATGRVECSKDSVVGKEYLDSARM
jgi:hypothetical protein